MKFKAVPLWARPVFCCVVEKIPGQVWDGVTASDRSASCLLAVVGDILGGFLFEL
jgi:hypothetical protein